MINLGLVRNRTLNTYYQLKGLLPKKEQQPTPLKDVKLKAPMKPAVKPVAKSAAKPVAGEKEPEEGSETIAKGSLETIVKKLVKKGKEKGFLTYDEINKSLPAEEFSSEQILQGHFQLRDRRCSIQGLLS